MIQALGGIEAEQGIQTALGRNIVSSYSTQLWALENAAGSSCHEYDPLKHDPG